MTGTHPQKLIDHLTKFYSHEAKFSQNADFEFINSYYHDVKKLGNIGMHSHAFYEINVITKGTGFHYIENGGFDVSVGEVFVIPPFVNHGYYTDGDLTIFHILIHCAFVERYKSELHYLPGYTMLFEIEPFLRATATDKCFLQLSEGQLVSVTEKLEELVALEPDGYMEELLDNSDKEREKKKNTNENEIRKIAKTLDLIAWLSKLMFDSHETNFHAQFHTETISVAHTIEYIMTHYYDKLTIDELAKIANMSKSTYIRHFKGVCKCTVAEYIMKIRIEKATDMLLASNKSIGEIAQDCGFFDSSHFSQNFKKEKGVTPTEFKRKALAPSDDE